MPSVSCVKKYRARNKQPNGNLFSFYIFLSEGLESEIDLYIPKLVHFHFLDQLSSMLYIANTILGKIVLLKRSVGNYDLLTLKPRLHYAQFLVRHG
jgi:hypothetical protein